MRRPRSAPIKRAVSSDDVARHGRSGLGHVGGQQHARRRLLAEAVGRCASVDPETVLGPVRVLFAATTDDVYDRTVRITMLDILGEAASPDTL